MEEPDAPLDLPAFLRKLAKAFQSTLEPTIGLARSRSKAKIYVISEGCKTHITTLFDHRLKIVLLGCVLLKDDVLANSVKSCCDASLICSVFNACTSNRSLSGGFVGWLLRFF